MIISQLSMCEECRNGSCLTCQRFKRRQRRAKEVAASKCALPILTQLPIEVSK